MVSDPFWYERPSILIQQNRLIEFFPHDEMSLYEKLNAIVRFAVYFAMIVYLFKRTTNMFVFPFFVLGITLYLFKSNNVEVIKETFSNGTCQLPSPSNPFMNVLMNDYTDDPQRPPACDINDPKIKQQMEENFEKNLYKNTVDIWGRNNSQREYYTMPNTTIPNDQINFANWLYKTAPTCKEISSQCKTTIDLRHKRKPIAPRTTAQ